MKPADGRTSRTAEHSNRRRHRSNARRSGNYQDAEGGFATVLAPVLSNRRLTTVMALAAALQLGLTTAGLPAWQCPLKTAMSLPCPACGLSSGVELLLRGQWSTALQAHLFSPLLLVASAAIGFLILMPPTVYRIFTRHMLVLERTTGFSTWLAVCFVLFWILRIAGGF